MDGRTDGGIDGWMDGMGWDGMGWMDIHRWIYIYK